MRQWLHNNIQLVTICTYILFVYILLIYFSVVNETFSYFQYVVNKWDGSHYLFLSQHGYQTGGEKVELIVFYPLYPLLISFLNILSPFPTINAMLISTVCTIAGIWFWLQWMKKVGFSNPTQLKTLVLLMVSPIDIYFIAPYTEGLFLLLTGAFFYLLYSKKFFLAALIGCLAATTRIMGVTLLLPYLIFFLEHQIVKTNARQMLYGSIIACGFFIYLGINYVTLGHPFAYQTFLEDIWFKSISNPILMYMINLEILLDEWRTVGWLAMTDSRVLDKISTLLFPFLILFYSLTRWKKLTTSHYIHTFFSQLKKFKTRFHFANIPQVKEPSVPSSLVLWSLAQWLIICSQSFWISNFRYLCIIFPIYIMITQLLAKSKFLFILVVISSFIWMAYAVNLFSKAEWLF